MHDIIGSGAEETPAPPTLSKFTFQLQIVNFSDISFYGIFAFFQHAQSVHVPCVPPLLLLVHVVQRLQHPLHNCKVTFLYTQPFL